MSDSDERKHTEMRDLFFLLLFFPPENKEQLQKVAQTLTRGLPATACPVSRAAPTARTTPPAWRRRMALSAWLFCPSSASACSPSSSAWSSSTTFAGTRYEQPPTSVSNKKTCRSLRSRVQICQKVKDFKVFRLARPSGCFLTGSGHQSWKGGVFEVASKRSDTSADSASRTCSVFLFLLLFFLHLF